jgi:hypothetical protein
LPTHFVNKDRRGDPYEHPIVPVSAHALAAATDWRLRIPPPGLA